MTALSTGTSCDTGFRGDYLISSDATRLDVDAIHAFLTTSYWCPGISKEIVERAIRGSLCFGLYHKDQQVGFARVISDEATYAYLCTFCPSTEAVGWGVG